MKTYNSTLAPYYDREITIEINTQPLGKKWSERIRVVLNAPAKNRRMLAHKALIIAQIENAPYEINDALRYIMELPRCIDAHQESIVDDMIYMLILRDEDKENNE